MFQDKKDRIIVLAIISDPKIEYGHLRPFFKLVLQGMAELFEYIHMCTQSNHTIHFNFLLALDKKIGN